MTRPVKYIVWGSPENARTTPCMYETRVVDADSTAMPAWIAEMAAQGLTAEPWTPELAAAYGSCDFTPPDQDPPAVQDPPVDAQPV